MTELPSPDPLYLVLDESPGDLVTLQALADWYEEQDDLSTAECLRWTVERQRWPFRYASRGAMTLTAKAWHDGWFWWALADRSFSREYGHPLECRLPGELWRHLPHRFDHEPTVFKEYPTRRDAYEALFAAWPRFVGRR